MSVPATRAQITEIVAQVLNAQLNLPPEGRYDDDTNIFEDLGADSLDAVELLISSDTIFDVNIDDEDCESVHTVGQLVTMLMQYNLTDEHVKRFAANFEPVDV